MFKLGQQILRSNGSIFRRFESQSMCCNLMHRNYSSAYEADGKTCVKVLNNDSDMGLMVNAFSEVNV